MLYVVKMATSPRRHQTEGGRHDGGRERVGARRADAANRLLAVFARSAGQRGLVERPLAELARDAGLDARAASAASALLRRCGRVSLLRRGGKHSQSLYHVVSAAPLEAEDTVLVAEAGERTQELTMRLYQALVAAAEAGVFRGSIAELGQRCGISAAQTRVAWRRVKQEFPILVLQEGKRYLPTVVRLDATVGTDGVAGGPLDPALSPAPSEAAPSGGAQRELATDAELEALALGRLALERLLEYGRAEATWEAELAEWRGRAERAEAELARLGRPQAVDRSAKSRSGAVPRLTPAEREKLVEILGLGVSWDNHTPGSLPRERSRG